jgi:hypothetical protein
MPRHDFVKPLSITAYDAKTIQKKIDEYWQPKEVQSQRKYYKISH